MTALRKLRSLFQARTVERELDDEMRFHLEMEEVAHIRAGKSVEEARRLARRSFGGVERYKDECREARGLQFLADFRRDLRFAVRTFARHPGVTAVTVLTLALGIGATTAIYGAVYGVLLAPLPYSDPERITTVWQNDRKVAGSLEGLSPPNFLDLKARNNTFASLAAAEPYGFDYQGPDGAVVFQIALVTPRPVRSSRSGFRETAGSFRACMTEPLRWIAARHER